jgi:hypothetical protein
MHNQFPLVIHIGIAFTRSPFPVTALLWILFMNPESVDIDYSKRALALEK